MIITPIDCFYIAMICTIFGFIIHLEISMVSLKAMMKEHVKFDSRMSDIGKHLQNLEKKL